MFDNLADRLEATFKKLKGHGKLSESNIQDGLKEVRMALLEADVHYQGGQEVHSGDQKARPGQEVMVSLTPGQQVIKIVNEELTELMGSSHEGIDLSGPKPRRSCWWAFRLRQDDHGRQAGRVSEKKGKTPVSGSGRRSTDRRQSTSSKSSARNWTVPVFDSKTDMDPVEICRLAKTEAQKAGCDVLLMDTAGRLHVDEQLMDELERIKNGVSPSRHTSGSRPP